MRIPFARAQIVVWGAFFAATLAAALLWWRLPVAMWDRGLLALLGLALSSMWRPWLRQTPVATAAGAARAVATGVALGLAWHALHQTLVAATFDTWSVVGLWRHGVPKMLATAAMPVGTMLAWGAAFVAVRALRSDGDVSGEAAVPADAPRLYADRLLVRGTGRVVPVAVSALRWVEAEGDYVRLHMGDGRSVLHRQTMAALERALDPGVFVRIHRSALVRVGAVREVRRLSRGDAEAVLDDGTVHRVGRAYRPALDVRLGG